jgi:hypothetical protein
MNLLSEFREWVATGDEKKKFEEMYTNNHPNMFKPESADISWQHWALSMAWSNYQMLKEIDSLKELCHCLAAKK